MSHMALWYLSRATGLVSFVLLSFVVVLGITVNRRGRVPGMPKSSVVGLHRNASLLAVVLLVVHIVTAIVDPFVTIGWAAVIVPFASHYQPFWLGMGALALDLLIAVVVTSLVRVRLGWRAWRGVHWLAYAAWPLAVIHGVGVAKDLHSGVLLDVTLATTAAVAVAISARVGSALASVPRGARSGRAVSDAHRSQGVPQLVASQR